MNKAVQVESPADYLRQEYAEQKVLFEAQPALVQRFFEAQARQLAQAIMQHAPQVSFALPDQVASRVGGQPAPIPAKMRNQKIGSWLDRFTRPNTAEVLRQSLADLAQSSTGAVAACAGLIRYATAAHLVHNMLPAGRSVTYVPAEGEELPILPAGDVAEPESAITATTDAIAEEGQGEAGRGELQVPYTPFARRFYLPQWVAFDDQDNLLVNSVSEAEAHLASMQRFVAVLHAAIALAPYMVADEDYQRKRYGMLGQLVNQGRAMARYKTASIIQTIKRRAAAQSLNRGLDLSLPYFDDQTLQLKTRRFQVIPAGRIMFIPAFVVRATREEQAKIAQDTRLSPSTRRHLLAELQMLEDAFASGN
jgi:hypothetical protein